MITIPIADVLVLLNDLAHNTGRCLDDLPDDERAALRRLALLLVAALDEVEEGEPAPSPAM